MSFWGSLVHIKDLCLEFCRQDNAARRLSDMYMLSPARTLVVISEEDDEVNYYALSHLDEYVASIYAQEVVLFTSSQFVEKNAVKLTKKITKVVSCQPGEIDEVLAYYRLGTDYMNFISLCRPEENTADRLVGEAGITKEDLICYCSYRLFQYSKVPAYEDFLHE